MLLFKNAFIHKNEGQHSMTQKPKRKITQLHWQILSIVLGGDGFENSNELCVVAHFYSEATVLCVGDTSSPHGDGRLFSSCSVGGGGGGA